MYYNRERLLTNAITPHAVPKYMHSRQRGLLGSRYLAFYSALQMYRISFYLSLSLLLLQVASIYTCKVNSPGLRSATANHKTHVILKLTESDGQPCSLQQNVTAQLELISENVPISVTRWPWSKKPKKHVAVVTTSPSQYKVSYTAISRGQHKLHIQVNDIDISGSPFTVTVYPDPTLLRHPVKVLTDANRPYGISFNKSGEIVVSECQGHRVSIFDTKGQKIRTFGSHGDSPDQMKFPQGVAIDEMDNMYVSSVHKLQKFTSDGELVKCVGQRGWKAGEFDDPRGVTLYNNHVYVCDCDNHRIQVFDLDLSFIRSINSDGTVRGEFNAPFDVKFDAAGNITAKRVRVMDNCGHQHLANRVK